MTAAAARFEPARSREELRLVELASGLLMLLDAHRLTGRLPLDIQVQASRLRHAVKLAVQAQAVRTAILPRPHHRPQARTRRRRCGPGSPPSRGSSRARWAGCTCCASATRPPAPTGPSGAMAVGVSTPATTGAGPTTSSAASTMSIATRAGMGPVGWSRSPFRLG
jgi:hypothetical protein